jgi:hypothetical protein
MERLGLEETGGTLRVGPVPQNQWVTTQHPSFGCVVPALWGTLEEIRRFGEVSGRISGNEG